VSEPLYRKKKISVKLDDLESKFPVELLNIKDLTNLEVIGGNISYLSEFISELHFLESLTLVTTKITQFPKEVFELPHLKYLSLKNNRIKEIPILTKKTNINILILNKNYISNLDFLECNFENLEYLDLGNNLLKAIPNYFESLKKIKRLNLENNQINEIPYILTNLKNLDHLSIDNNQFNQDQLNKIHELFYN
jgi:Leucine-rich repeat (LRR) protein